MPDQDQPLTRALRGAGRLAATRLDRVRGLPARWRELPARWRELPLPRPWSTPADAGRELDSRELARVRRQFRACVDARGGELSARARADELSRLYTELSPSGRERFVTLLATEFGVDQDAVVAAARRVAAGDGTADRRSAIQELRASLQAPWLTILRQINSVPSGTAVLVELRADLLRFARGNEELTALEHDLRTLLASWFDLGFLELRRITWDSPASLLERLAASEAVHAVTGWEDLKNRLDSDRRVFGFFHPRLPNEPIVFVEVALGSGLASAIQPLLDPDAPLADPKRADTAIFYSISSAQPGLSGISFGGFLIKQVVDALAAELPRIRTFATLSPIPGLRDWLERQLADGEEPELAEALFSGRFPPDPEPAELRPALLRLCAEYLLTAKREDGRSLDRVANFHLGNGARIEQLNWLADTSEPGLRDSFGIMVNYLYSLADIDANHEAYVGEGAVAASPAVTRLVQA